ncbi:hypothetical protein [Nostoc sp. FACHB-145]|uniref:hypothetical protein n=1 Tax=Nostoc sp. FACHB-145 TaxID=2692836 RepID=UPI001687AC9D|nr:hypothetical protein [Nostoc sp. FACHB-145]MBD2472387.1 hypothetical protein [Nostoc sp. FACHB-145]
MACILFFSPHPSIEASQIPSLDYSTANSYAVVANQNNNFANVNSETNPPSHSPIRQATSGSCSCPYDIDKAGRSCGGRSAYSRPGGSHPICYLDD